MKNVQDQLQLILRGIDRLIDAEELKQKLSLSIANSKPLIIKLGVDPTAPDIHLGHTVPLRKLRHFQDLGHEVVFLIGDFTAQIGDPTGRDKTRPALTFEEIRANANTYLEQVAKVLDINKLRVVFNSEWLDKLTFGELVKMAANTTMAKMLEHNTFRQRMESSESIRMHELLYPFMQGFDSVALKADVELGGSDQTFNLTFGRDLQRFHNQTPQVCITMPILNGTDGVQKMSKSLGNYIGINEAPAIMFDKIMQMSDTNIVNYMTLLTDIADEEIEQIIAKFDNGPTTEFIIATKKRLAFEIVKSFHSEDIADQLMADFGKMKKVGLPEVEVAGDIIKDQEVKLVRLMHEKLGFKSLSESRRQIKQGAVSINGEKVDLSSEFIKFESGDILKCGKTKIFRIIVQP